MYHCRVVLLPFAIDPQIAGRAGLPSSLAGVLRPVGIEKMHGDLFGQALNFVLLEVEPVPFENGKDELAVEPVVISLGIRERVGHVTRRDHGVVHHLKGSVHDRVGHVHVVGDPRGENAPGVGYRPVHPGPPARAEASCVFKIPVDGPRDGASAVLGHRLSLHIVPVHARRDLGHVDRSSGVLKLEAISRLESL